MDKGVKIPLVEGLIFHGYGGRFTMGKEVQNTMCKGVDISWVEESIFHGRVGAWSIYHV